MSSLVYIVNISDSCGPEHIKGVYLGTSEHLRSGQRNYNGAFTVRFSKNKKNNGTLTIRSYLGTSEHLRSGLRYFTHLVPRGMALTEKPSYSSTEANQRPRLRVLRVLVNSMLGPFSSSGRCPVANQSLPSHLLIVPI